MVSRDPPPKGLRKPPESLLGSIDETVLHRGVNLVSHPVYLQLFQQFVVVCNGGLQGLKEFLLSLQLLCHCTRPPSSCLRVLRLADVRETRTSRIGRLHSEHPTLCVAVHPFLKLHLVHLYVRLVVVVWTCELGF